jgi:small subunit ribosomal protein S6
MSVIHASYEALMIFSVKKGEEETTANLQKFKELISAGAALEAVDEWGKRRLAYLIQKEAEGYYVLFNFKAPADFPAELERVAGITDGVLRILIVKKEEAKKKPEPVQETAES